MRKYGTGLMIIFAIVLASLGTAAAQESSLPPTIISFASDRDSIPIADAEAGQTPVTLSWQVVGLTDQHRLVLHTYRFKAREPLLPEDTAPLLANGSQTIAIEHPNNFGPPTYSLMILDTEGTVLDQRILVITYEDAADAAPPTIENFATPIQTLSANDVSLRQARVEVAWRIANRAPLTNLVFEQVLEDGRVVPVELPRANLWIPSEGEGVLAPVLPGAGEPVRLRLRVVDMRDGNTLAEQLLPSITLTGTAVAEPAPTEAAPSSAPAAQIVTFEASPETVGRSGTVTLNWDVTNASSVGVWLLDLDGRLSRSAPSTASSGSWTVTLPDVYTAFASFMLFAENAAGQQVQAGVTVDVICPFTYFFGASDNTSCPEGEAMTVQAAFQMFERGYMIWRGDNSEILVLFADSGRVERYRDSWQGEAIVYDEIPPQGLYQPVRGFGKVWVENFQVREGIGWSVTLEQGYTMTYQPSGSFQNPRLFLDWPDATVIYVGDDTWGFVD